MGAGGGSIAWLDDGHALQVGPQSAGADPGPACYGNGGRAPTVTDGDVQVTVAAEVEIIGKWVSRRYTMDDMA